MLRQQRIVPRASPSYWRHISKTVANQSTESVQVYTVPATCACFAIEVKAVELVHFAFDLISSAASLNKLTKGLRLSSASSCCNWPSLLGTTPSHGTTCMKWTVSFCLCNNIPNLHKWRAQSRIGWLHGTPNFLEPPKRPSDSRLNSWQVAVGYTFFSITGFQTYRPYKHTLWWK